MDRRSMVHRNRR